MKINLALVWGGYSSESIVSEKSKDGLLTFLDSDKYNIFPLQITKNDWTVSHKGTIYNVDKNDFSFLSEEGKIKFDFAYITIHGTPGEDGRLQGYLEMLNIPHSTCTLETSSLLFNKFYCNTFFKNFGFSVANSLLLRQGDQIDAKAICEKIKLPMFVKPNVGGSSFATTKVKEEAQLLEAINVAFEEANQVIVESFIDGLEVTCGCFEGEKGICVLPITEVVSKNEYFDYAAKYQGASEEITPARISDHLTNLIKLLTKQIYTLVQAKGFIRADYIISKEGIPFLLEVNTTPGMTQTSFIPQQIVAANLQMKNVLTDIIEKQMH